MYAWHLTGLSTAQRSLQALLLSSDFRLRDTLLSGRPIRNHAPSAIEDMDGVLRQLSPRFDQIYTSMLNPSQLKAVKAACVSEGFTLCQGERRTDSHRMLRRVMLCYEVLCCMIMMRVLCCDACENTLYSCSLWQPSAAFYSLLQPFET